MMIVNKQIVVGFSLYQGVRLLDFAGATRVFVFSDGFKLICSKNIKEQLLK